MMIASNSICKLTEKLVTEILKNLCVAEILRNVCTLRNQFCRHKRTFHKSLIRSQMRMRIFLSPIFLSTSDLQFEFKAGL